MKMSNCFEPVAKEARTNESFLVAAIGNVRGVLAQCFARDETQAKAAIEALTMDSMGGAFKVEVIDREAAPGLWLEGSAEYIKGVLRDRQVPNYIEQPEASQDKAVEPKNVFGQVAVKPFYIWANEDCANKSDSFKQAKAIRLALFNDGGKSVHIVDADGVEVVDAEIEAHEALVNAGYYAGARKPDVKPEFPGAFMVNDPQDPDGFAIVGDDVAALILEARDHLIDPAAVREEV